MLLTCPECGRKVSDRAAVCPNCGCPMEDIKKIFTLRDFDSKTMTGKTEADSTAIEIAEELYGELLVSNDGRVWNTGGQVVAEMQYRSGQNV